MNKKNQAGVEFLVEKVVDDDERGRKYDNDGSIGSQVIECCDCWAI